MHGRYSKTRSVGKGSFGTVWLVKDTRTGESLIMKEVVLKGLPPSEKIMTHNEVRVLQKLEHPNIIGYRDSFVDSQERLCILMEWASGGDLAKKIESRRREGKRFEENEILDIMRQLVAALNYCHHDLKLLHRDLKPANVFLGANGEVKLGDFGISKIMAVSCQLNQTQCGTPLYMSPEQARGASYSRLADVWAIGCILYEMLTLRAPWSAQMGANAPGGISGLLRRISTDRLHVDTRGLRAKGYSDELLALLTAMLNRNPAARPTLATLSAWPILQPPGQDGAAGRSPAAQHPTLAPAAGAAPRRSRTRTENERVIESHGAAAAIQRSFRRQRGVPPLAEVSEEELVPFHPPPKTRHFSPPQPRPTPLVSRDVGGGGGNNAPRPAGPPAAAAYPPPPKRTPSAAQQAIAADKILRSFRRAKAAAVKPSQPSAVPFVYAPRGGAMRPAVRAGGFGELHQAHAQAAVPRYAQPQQRERADAQRQDCARRVDAAPAGWTPVMLRRDPSARPAAEFVARGSPPAREAAAKEAAANLILRSFRRRADAQRGAPAAPSNPFPSAAEAARRRAEVARPPRPTPAPPAARQRQQYAPSHAAPARRPAAVANEERPVFVERCPAAPQPGSKQARLAQLAAPRGGYQHHAQRQIQPPPYRPAAGLPGFRFQAAPPVFRVR